MRFFVDFLHDMRHQLRARTSARVPIQGILTLAAGIAGVTLTFALVDTFVINAVPFPDGDRPIEGRGHRPLPLGFRFVRDRSFPF